MKRLGMLALLMVTALFATSATAQDQYSMPGPYVQLAGSYARCSFEASDGSSSGDCSDVAESSLGLNGRIGFRFNRFFTVEGQIEWISGFDAKPGTLSGGATEASVEAISYTINARFYPIEGRIQPYAIAGLGGENVWVNSNGEQGDSDTFTSFIGRFGAGLDIYVTPQLALTGEFTYVAATEAKATYYGYWDYWTEDSGVDPSYMSVSWGLMYRF